MGEFFKQVFLWFNEAPRGVTCSIDDNENDTGKYVLDIQYDQEGDKIVIIGDSECIERDFGGVSCYDWPLGSIKVDQLLGCARNDRFCVLKENDGKTFTLRHKQ